MSQAVKKPSSTKKTDKSTKKSPKATEKPLIAPNTVLKLTIPAKQAGQAYAQAVAKLAKKITVAGFRKGKVPAQVAQEQLKPSAIIEEALQTVIPALYQAEIEKSGLKPVTYPEFNPVSLEKDADWVVEAHIAERPEIKLDGFEKIVTQAKKSAQKELEKRLAELQKHIEESKDEKHDHSHDEPSEQEKKDFIVNFIYGELISTLKPQIQELLVKEETRYDLDQLAGQLKQLSISFETFLEQRKMSFEDLSSELAAGALSRLQRAFLIDAIAKNAQLEVTDADLQQSLQAADPELKQHHSDPRYLDMLSQTLLRQKVAEYVLNLK